MASEKVDYGNEITSSNQLAAILFVSAAFISTGVFAFSKIPGCRAFNEASASIQITGAKTRFAMDSEMQNKYRVIVSKRPKPENIQKRILCPTMAPR
jgi:hypothetical protein